ncbi:MAG: hypothetical protein BM563_08415 [Bacteroidetes bacterium MedPE-SWsnd-G1]|nr:MAG: hypothetical protein BM563_08415 [Bacteroidetes bacterium MedPE-SWsnd-G1]
MKRRYFIGICLGFLYLFNTQNFLAQNKSVLWGEIGQLNRAKLKELKVPSDGDFYTLNTQKLSQDLSFLPLNPGSQSKSSVVINLPTPNGAIEEFVVSDASVFSKELQSEYPLIRSYTGQSKNFGVRFSFSPQKGLSVTYISGEELGFLEFVENDSYILYDRSNKNNITGKFECLTDDVQNNVSKSVSTVKDANDGVLRTFRLALSVTAEYTEYFHGGSVGVGEEDVAKAAALAAMNATLTRVNGVFERDFAVRLQLISSVNDIIYTNPATDPYSDYTSNDNWNTELQTNLTATIGESNYDIGHLFGHDGGGGNAGCIGCVCTDNLKGSAYTSPADGVPSGDYFDLDYVAHELGHQFGANHTWTTDTSGPNNEGTGANLEPGSGSTIMGYAGITTSNVQGRGDDYFHFKSIEQVTDFVQSLNCDTESNLGQITPTANAGSDYTIPISTAFVLRGQGTSDGPTSYCWEQNDEGGNGGIETSNPSPTNATGPTFRSLKPTSNPDRYMPSFASVINGTLSTTWETVSDVARDLDFKLTVRDNLVGGGQNAIDAMKVTVDGTAEPFTITSQNEEGIIWSRGGSEIITWNVSTTNSAPINTSHVNILLSLDNGETFTTLIENTPNDGSQEIAVPFTAAPYCRLLIEAVDNIYYAVNSHAFAIDYLVEKTCEEYTDAPNMPITDNSTDFDETTISIPGDFMLSEIEVAVDVSHTYLNDLLISLVSPSGTEIKLIERSCSSNEDLMVNFSDSGDVLQCQTPTTGVFIPVDPLADLNGEVGNGEWTLRINDNAADDTGVLNSWTVNICSTEETAINTGEFVNVYPNPSSEFVNIFMVSKSEGDATVSIIDAAGRAIYWSSYPLNNEILNVEVNYGSIAQGLYVLKIEQGGNVTSKRIIVK